MNDNLSFAVDDNSLFLGFLLLSLVLSDSVQEILTTARVLHMLHADVDPLRQDTTSDRHDNTMIQHRDDLHHQLTID